MQTKLKVNLLTHTPNPEKVVAAAAKLCYSKSGADSITKNLSEETTKTFIEGLLKTRHESPFEHVSFTFAAEGVSRALTHQLVRHRLASYSQKSQRYVDESGFSYVVPKEIEGCPKAKTEYVNAMTDAQLYYDNIVYELIENMLKDIPEETIKDKDRYVKEYKKIQKRAMENARYVLPNACETKIVITMNARELRHFFSLRCCNRAQEEIRNLANKMLAICKEVAPTLFSDAGAPCVNGKCPEGAMSCKKQLSDGILK